MSADTSLTILGPPSVTAAQIVQWLQAIGHGGDGRLNGATIEAMAGWYISEGQAQGVRGDVAFAQACLETGYFTNDDTALNNFAGIGHPESALSGLYFLSPQIGVRAQIQLLAQVVGGNSTKLASPDMSPGWGGRQTFTWGGLHAAGWASDPAYGSKIISIYNSMLGGAPVQNTDPATGFPTTTAPAVQPVGDSFTVSNVAAGQIPGIDPKYTPMSQVTAQTFRWPVGLSGAGGAPGEAVAAAVTTDSTVDLANGQLSQIQLTVADPDRTLTAGLPGTINQDSGHVGQYALWGSDVLAVAELQTLGTNRVPSMIVTLRAACLQWMATKRVQRVWNGLSASQWIESAVSEYNAQLPSGVPPATFLGQPTAAYAGGIMANPSMPVTQWQSYYDIAQQLCFDEGCWLFESGGCVVFGQPEWIVTVAPTVKIGYRGLPGYPNAFPMDSDATEALDYPNCLRSVSVFTGDTMQVDVPRAVGEQMRVGQQIALSGVPYWSATKWIVTGVQFQLDGGRTAVQITANEAKNPVPSAPSGVAPSPPQTDPTGHAPIPTNLQFVQLAETQTGKPYVWGGESPSSGFDCSGLVQWSLQQLGITFPRTSGQQLAACRAVPGADKGPALAALINGALLFKDGGGIPGGEHVAISLGQTRNGGDEVLVFQAPYTGAKIGSAWVNVSYFDEGAIIPSLNYGSQGGTSG